MAISINSGTKTPLETIFDSEPAIYMACVASTAGNEEV
jgi:hypothetical protein